MLTTAIGRPVACTSATVVGADFVSVLPEQAGRARLAVKASASREPAVRAFIFIRMKLSIVCY